jgi:hypothetical protein
MATTAEERSLQQGLGQEEAARLRADFPSLASSTPYGGCSDGSPSTFSRAPSSLFLAAIPVCNVAFPRLNPVERFYGWETGPKKG